MKIIIDEKDVEVFAGDTILTAAKRAGIYIPTLCHNEAFDGQGRCRLCLVEVDNQGMKKVVTACTYPVVKEITVKTSTPQIIKMRKNVIMLLYKRASGSKLMQDMFREYGCEDNQLQENPEEKCILCNLCVLACEKMGSSAISLIMRGTDKKVATPYNEAAEECIGCGACAEVCPTDAIELVEKVGTRTIWNKQFKLVNCQRCGTPFATEEQLAFIQAKGKDNEMLSYCENCRRKMTAEKIQSFN